MNEHKDQREAEVRLGEVSGEYEAPQIQTFTPDQLLEVLGPAQGYGGSARPGTRGGLGRGHRLFPGLR